MDQNTKVMESSCKTPTKNPTSLALLGQQFSYKTPPRIIKVKNPFEHVLREHLGTNFISPTLFTAKKSVRCSENFSWTIDERARLNPADIDEHSSNQFESPDRDEQHYDSITQSRIDTYFSMQQILPSPMQLPVETVPLIKSEQLAHLSPTSDTTSHLPNVTHSYAQTVLTLPPTLPEEVERVLRPYFTFTEDQTNQQGYEVHEKSVLYQELFDSPKCDASDDDRSDEENEENFSDVFGSPQISAMHYKNSTQYQRTIGTPGNYDMINLCEMSPISSPVKIVEVEPEVVEIKAAIRNSSQVMSIDGSFTVPDIEKMNRSQLDSSHHSTESLNSSAMNWDLEYKQMSSPIAITHNDAMDLSLNTPKQRLFLSQRKKLSDSFGNDDKPVIEEEGDVRERLRSESGYHTTSFQSIDSSLRGAVPRTAAIDATGMWTSINVVSSTPTKRKHCF